MKIGAILFGIVIIFLMIAGLGFAVANLSATQITDTYGSAPSAAVNDTSALLANVSSAGQAGGTGLLLVVVCIGLIIGVGLLIVYARTR